MGKIAFLFAGQGASTPAWAKSSMRPAERPERCSTCANPSAPEPSPSVSGGAGRSWPDRQHPALPVCHGFGLRQLRPGRRALRRRAPPASPWGRWLPPLSAAHSPTRTLFAWWCAGGADARLRPGEPGRHGGHFAPRGRGGGGAVRQLSRRIPCQLQLPRQIAVAGGVENLGKLCGAVQERRGRVAPWRCQELSTVPSWTGPPGDWP